MRKENLFWDVEISFFETEFWDAKIQQNKTLGFYSSLRFGIWGGQMIITIHLKKKKKKGTIVKSP